ncbi:MAG: DUF1343 domain-containing protein [Candidatus Riflebacteria bacterium]|nr:DUF1343 domain-containing protein [Candidatus Riflebacteria bacterium]
MTNIDLSKFAIDFNSETNVRAVYSRPIKLVFFFFAIFLFLMPSLLQAANINLGIDVLGRHHPELVRNKSVALFTSSAARDVELTSSIDRLAKASKIRLIITGDPYWRTVIPGEKGQKFDAFTNALIYEMSDPLQRPPASIFNGLDLLIIDFQDIGVRFFKYITIMAQLLDVAREAQIPVVLLDRPNPLGGNLICGPMLDINLRTRFGVYPIPVVYGMTVGELALYFNKVFGINSELTVIGMEGYSRNATFKEMNLHWLPPFAHLPEADSALYYAVTGWLAEIGVFSTGVGTPRPFHYILAPWIDAELVANKLSKFPLSGVAFIPTEQRVYYGLFSGQNVPGIEIAILDQKNFDPFLTGVSILTVLYELYPERIPLSNNAVAGALDALIGTPAVREAIVRGSSVEQALIPYAAEFENFVARRGEFLIYANQ